MRWLKHLIKMEKVNVPVETAFEPEEGAHQPSVRYLISYWKLK